MSASDIPEFSPDPSSKHFTGEYNKTETLIYIESSSPSVIEDSRPGTPNTTFFYENKYNFDSIDNEKPSTSKRPDKIYNNNTPMPSACIDFCISTPATNGNATDSSTSTPTCRSRKRISRPKKEKGRQRERFVKEWKDDIRKRNVNRGLQYVSRNRKVHNKKLLKPPCPLMRRKKCYEKIPEENRAKIFNIFWDIGDHIRQWDFTYL
ncbi:hypothetical protein ACJJTC_011808 [Scirpophaga incertulas]